MSLWVRNLQNALERRHVVLLHGNVRDWYFDIENGSLHENLTAVLAEVARGMRAQIRFEQVVLYDTAALERRITLVDRPAPVSAPAVAAGEFGAPPARREGAAVEPPDRVFARWTRELTVDRPSQFMIVNYLDKLVGYQTSYSETENRILLWLEKVIENIADNHRLVLVALRETMVPVEVYANSPKTYVLSVPPPDKKDRMAFVAHRLGRAFPHGELLADLTEGLFLRDLNNIYQAIPQRGQVMSSQDLRRVVNRYRLGDQQDYFASLDLQKLDQAFETMTRDEGVHGQDDAVRTVVNTLRLARAGLSGMSSGNPSKPKGVLFFAGPSGVGKTLLAKKLAKFLFGSEEAFHRYDMSELKEEHAVSKLIGSPPGYVGSERGGSLTNAVRVKPFSVVLFDEVEKAHPKIMDLFLQILDDGRLTDSLGQTVFFSETVIIFTSNLGTRSTNSRGLPINEKQNLDHLLADGRSSADERRRRIAEHFVDSVEQFFLTEISRPELLNRIGNNIVPFRHIDTEDVQTGIIESHLNRIRTQFDEQFRVKGYTFRYEPAVVVRLRSQYGGRISMFGGRGIAHALDTAAMRLLANAVLWAEHNLVQAGTFILACHDERADEFAVTVRWETGGEEPNEQRFR